MFSIIADIVTTLTLRPAKASHPQWRGKLTQFGFLYRISLVYTPWINLMSIRVNITLVFGVE